MKIKLGFYTLYIFTTIVIFLSIFEGVVYISSEYSLFKNAVFINHKAFLFLNTDEFEMAIFLIILFTLSVLIHSLFISSWVFSKITQKNKLMLKGLEELTQFFKRNILFTITSCVCFLSFGFLPTLLEFAVLVIFGNLYQGIPLTEKRKRMSRNYSEILDIED